MRIEMKVSEPIQMFSVGGQRYLRGYAARFYDGTPNTEGEGPGYTIRIQQNAFDRVLNDSQTLLRFNHSREYPMGNRKTGLELTKDRLGVQYSHPVVDTPDFKKVEYLMDNEMITGSSWKGDAIVRWSSDGERDIATIEQVENLEDVGPCDIPACTGTGLPVIMSSNSLDDLNKQHTAWIETKKRLAMAI